MKIIIVITILLCGLNSMFSQELSLKDTANIEIITNGMVKTCKYKNIVHYRDKPFTEEPVNPIVWSDDYGVQLDSIIKKSFSSNNYTLLKDKSIFLSFNINCNNGTINSVQVKTHISYQVNLSKKEYLILMHNIKNEFIFNIVDNYKDIGDINISLRRKI